MNFLNFLNDVAVENVEMKTVRNTGKKQRQPDANLLGIRVWKDGSVFPSASLVSTFGLEYPAATVSSLTGKDGKAKSVFTVVGAQGNGLDVIDVRMWAQVTAANKNFIAVAIAPKDSSKIDLFGMTRYAEDGTPLVSVLEQGSATFGKETLLPLVKELYGAEPNEEGFIDLVIATEEEGGKNLKSANGLELIPKKISRGADKGKLDYTRRENVNIFMMYPATVVEATDATSVADTEEDVTVEPEVATVAEAIEA